MKKHILFLMTLVMIVFSYQLFGQISCDSLNRLEEDYVLEVDLENDTIFNLFGDHIKQLFNQADFEKPCSFSFIYDYLITSRYMEKETSDIMGRALDIYNAKLYPGEHMALLAEKVIPYYMVNDREMAEILLDSIINIHRNNDNYTTNAADLGMIASVFSDFERFSEADELFRKAVEIADPTDSLVMFMTHYRLAINANTTNNLDATLKSLEDANRFITDSIGDYGLSEFFMFRGMAYLDEGDNIKAIEWLNKSKSTFQHPMIIMYVFRGLLDSHSDPDSLDFYHVAMKNHLEKYDEELYQNVKKEGYLGLKNYYFNNRDITNFDKTADYLYSTLDTAEFYQKTEYYKLKIDQFSLKKLNSEELNILNSYFNLLEEKHDSTIIESTNDLRIKFENSLTKKENEKLKTEQLLKEEKIDRQQKVLIGGITALGVFSLFSVLLYRQREKQKKLNTKLTLQRDQIKLLNRELNHRVKNNLAFMTSLLEMQGRRTENMETKQVLRESESRLKTLSIVHNNLFQNESTTKINLKNYLLEIVNHLQDIFELPDKSLQINTNLVNVEFDAEDAMRVGLIINELITNSIKHAFKNIDAPAISIETKLLEDGKIILQYGDNGPGIIQKDLQDSVAISKSIGLKLIHLLQQQLEYRLDLQFDY